MADHKNVPKTNFQRVAAMNEAFGNKKGDPKSIDYGRVAKQSLNIPDETGELFIALGVDPDLIKSAVRQFKQALSTALEAKNEVNLEKVRDALCDVPVFSYGAQHFMGIDADRDMTEVVDKVMTRFIRDEDDKAATIKFHADNGVTDVYFEGDYPLMIMKSGSDQPDAPKGKFLKSASFSEPVFYRID